MNKKVHVLLIFVLALALLACFALTALAADKTSDAEKTVTVKLNTAELNKLVVDYKIVVAVDDKTGADSAIFAFTFSKPLDSSFRYDVEFSVAGVKLLVPAEVMQKLSAEKVFRLELSAEQFAFLDSKGDEIVWHDYANPLQLSLPYIVPADSSTATTVISQKADDGTEIIIPRSWYYEDAVHAKVYQGGSFVADYLGSIDFSDIKNLWMKEAVDYMSARKIVNGVSEQLFAPNNTVNKAEFVTMLMRSLNIKIEASTTEAPYVDQDSIPEWAKESFITAKALGLTLADADHKVNATADLPREDMFLLAYQAMDAAGMLPDAMTLQFIVFKDWDDVSEDASQAIQVLAILKLANGWDGNIVPQGTSTRAQAAQFLYNILKMDVPKTAAPVEEPIEKIADLAGKTVAVPKGSIADELVKSKVADAKFVYFDSAQECVDAINAGKADAAAYDEPIIKSLLAANDNIRLLEEMVTTDNYGYAVALDNADLKKAADKLLAELKKDGTYDEMIDRWLPEKGITGDMPEIKSKETEGKLVFATAAVTAPFSYLDATGKNYLGFDIEFAYRLAASLDKELEIVNVDFADLLEYVSKGKADIAGACITITDERAKLVSFTNSYYKGGIAVVVAK